ncbi:MAG: 50S ribosomal protein L9 [Spirochaetes bacterium]|nr:50S ribosomal protein L9 [Spirochaetota bacterium]
MEVILKKDHATLGYEGDVCKVKAGFARNYLLPRNIAVVATEASLRTLKALQKSLEKKKVVRKGDADVVKAKLEAATVTITMKVGENDKLYGSVTSQTIADALIKDGFHVQKRDIIMEDHIRALGVFKVNVRIYTDVIAEVKVWVVKE